MIPHARIFPVSHRSFFKVLVGATLSLFSFASSFAADFGETEVEWQFKSGLDRGAFSAAFDGMVKGGFRIADIESYRSGRSTTVSTVWTKLAVGDAWQIEMSLPVSEFLAIHEKHLKDGYSLAEFEIDRFGATLHFSGVWLKTDEGFASDFYFGMESLEFSNRYGEMADRGYRLIDFEVYESNGKFRHAGIWIKNTGGEVRFYRAIEKNRFGEVAAHMAENGFRLVDIEGYEYEGKFVYAGQWVHQQEWQESQYSFDLLADEFYNKNSAYVKDGYRLTEFETYEDKGVVYYAGSWLKGNPADFAKKQVEEGGKKKPSTSLEAFRSGEK